VEIVVGMVKVISLKLKTWEGTVNFTTVPMADFELVMGQKSMGMMKLVLIPHLDNLVILVKDQTYVIPTM